MERDARTVTVGRDEYEDLMAKADQYEVLMERASMASAMYRDLQTTVNLWERIRQAQARTAVQCREIEATSDAATLISARIETLTDCLLDVGNILRRYAALDPAQPVKGGEGDADGPESTG